jgi:phosphatidate phosphatase APP1
MVISDMDDTVIHTGITNILVSAQLTFLYNAKTRKPLLGVGELYRSLALGTQGEPHNPVFYVSNSAWNMFDLLRDFLDLNDLPAGPLLLRDIGFNANSSDHKIDSLRRLLSRFPELSAVLVGDSGQHDAAIYATAAREFPGRVRAIYIRDVDPETDSKYDVNVDGLIADSQKLGIPFLRVRDSSQIADHARTIGLVSEADISEIEAGVELDRQRDSVMEEATKPSESDKQ